ncbi:hypothetical protein [Bradyrhizobium sp. RDM4]|uniref:hypothetical protein n=1 Tax=Bradyrhizobium sp. RDM4 TaxID=3378765 RepID=UPI0038FD0267
MRDGGVGKVGRFSWFFGTSGPDGLTVDQNGTLFVAHDSVGHVFVWAPNGEAVRSHPVLRRGELHECRVRRGTRRIAHYGTLPDQC